MSQRLSDELRKYNLCTYFILPLLRLNKASFVNSNFANCYLTPTHDCIVVQIVDATLLSRKLFVHKFFISRVQGSQYTYLIYAIPKVWSEDVELFCNGQFSRMSLRAKRRIFSFSGLSYREKAGQKTVTDGRLLALTKDPVLKEAWLRFFEFKDDSCLPDNGELLSIPGQETYITEYV